MRIEDGIITSVLRAVGGAAGGRDDGGSGDRDRRLLRRALAGDTILRRDVDDKEVPTDVIDFDIEDCERGGSILK